MKLYSMFLLTTAMTSTVLAGAANMCGLDPAPAPLTPTSASGKLSTETIVAGGFTSQQQSSVELNKKTTFVSGSGNSKQPSVISGSEHSTVGSIVNSYSYTGVNSGGPGSYDQVTDIASCSKSRVTTSNPVSPLDTGVTMAFRGPMTISDIAVFDGTNGTWVKVSSYKNGGAATNMVFLNNENIDFTGTRSPEGFSQADGTGVAQQSTPFSGTLASASKPSSQSIVASEITGAEVHIVTENKCGVDVQCEGAYDLDGTAFQGWTGSKKIFLTKVSMEEGEAPNVPAIWMLPDQVTHSGQYGCNCRGIGPAGGCGELDIAEVLEKDTSFVATHFYFYGGTFNPGNDRFGKRPTSGHTTYVTIIDRDYGIKIIELGADDFDFSAGTLAHDVVLQWEAAK